ncbi:MAG TPA: PTS sugar transporter [Planctomycetota bacterium]|jgi:mannose PTS system EIIA component|nr:PTS sugar transporter [Planctomycetota bacterium]
MISIVVVTHGQLAEELVNAARTIHGELPGIVAVPLGWGDDAVTATSAIGRAIVGIGGDTLVLTDMFGGTPTNLSLPYLSAQVEIVTGVNLPMIIKAATLREGPLEEVARAVRDQGKGAIYVASEILAKKS